ncbi:MAG: hypothetical protein ACRDH2_11420 [Anaerolineales bacterium]
MAEIPLYQEGEDVPIPRAREDMRFTEAAARPLPDGRRVKLNFKLTPFADRPSVDMSVTNLLGNEVASMSLIEAMDTEFEFTVHLRGPQPEGGHNIHLTLFYQESDDPDAPRQVVDERDVAFTVAPPN